MKLSILIVAYNISPADSATLQSILKASFDDISSTQIVYWHNGPSLLTDEETLCIRQLCDKKEIPLLLYNTADNFPLSSIYNFFVQQAGFTHYLIFDHDSQFKQNFFSRLAEHPDENILLPITVELVTGKQFGPCTKKSPSQFQPITKEGRYSGISIYSVTSGICLSHDFIQMFSQKYGTVFNEAFALYAIDTCFFNYLALYLREHPVYSFCIVNSIIHSLSEFLDEGNDMKNFKTREMFFANILLRMQSKKKSRRAAISYALRKCGFKILQPSLFAPVLRCIITKRHPRLSRQLHGNFMQFIDTHSAQKCLP